MSERVTDAKVFRYWGKGVLLRKEDRSLEEAVKNRESTHSTSRPSGVRIREKALDFVRCRIPCTYNGGSQMGKS